MVGASTIVERTRKTSNVKWRQGSLISQNPLNLWGICQQKVLLMLQKMLLINILKFFMNNNKAIN